MLLIIFYNNLQQNAQAIYLLMKMCWRKKGSLTWKNIQWCPEGNCLMICLYKSIRHRFSLVSSLGTKEHPGSKVDSIATCKFCRYQNQFLKWGAFHIPMHAENHSQ